MNGILGRNELIWLVYIIINYTCILFAYRKWGKLGLFTFLPISIILANIQVSKLVVLFGFETTLGNIAYSSIFIISDILTENYGEKEARKTVVLGFVTMIFTTIVMNIALSITPSSSDFNQEHIKAIFGPFTRFTFASLLAYLISSNVDISLYTMIKKINPDYKSIWIRNNGSTLFSQVIDNVVFNTVAFIGVFSIPIIISIIFSTYFLKVITSLFDTPFLYIATKWKQSGVIED